MTEDTRPDWETVYIDFESTGVGKEDRMIQYAVMKGGDGADDGISSYVYTRREMHPKAVKVTQITNADLDILKNEGRTEEPAVALNRIFDYIRTAARNVVLVAYNGRGLDFPLLMRETFRHLPNARSILKSTNIRFLFDPFCMTKHWKTTGRRRQSDIYRMLFSEAYNEHDALDDTRALRRIVEHERISGKINLHQKDPFCNQPYKEYYLEFYYTYKRDERAMTERIKKEMRARQMSECRQRAINRKRAAPDEEAFKAATPKRLRFSEPSTGPCRVVRLRRTDDRIVQGCDVYIGREWHKGGWDFDASKWANPFRAAKASEKGETVERYRDYLMDNPDLMSQLEELKGKTLGCWCKPGPCHGDVLVELVKMRFEKA